MANAAFGHCQHNRKGGVVCVSPGLGSGVLTGASVGERGMEGQRAGWWVQVGGVY